MARPFFGISPNFIAFVDLEAINCIATVFNYKVSGRIFAQKDRDDLPGTAPFNSHSKFFSSTESKLGGLCSTAQNKVTNRVSFLERRDSRLSIGGSRPIKRTNYPERNQFILEDALLFKRTNLVTDSIHLFK